MTHPFRGVCHIILLIARGNYQKMEYISEHLQDSLVLLSITNSEFLKIVSNQIPAEFFESEVVALTYKICTAYCKKFGHAPGDHFQDEIMVIADKLEPAEREMVARYLKHLSEMRAPSKEYVLSRLNDFIRKRKLTAITYEFAEHVEKGEIDIAIEKMTIALRSGIQHKQSGYDLLFDNDIIGRKDKPERLLKFGIETLDRSIRIQRQDFITIAGPYKGGKSWFGHYIGKQALLQRLNVLHVSHENSERETVKRYDMIFGALLDEEEPREVEIKQYKDGKTYKKKFMRDTIYNRELVMKNRQKIRKFGGRLIIKKFPMGVCKPQELNAFISYLENFEGFIPDVVINDYADIMAPCDSNKQTRDAINEVYIYLKRIADDHNLCMITFSQINDEGIKTLIHKGRVEGRHLAEDKRKWGNIDKGYYIGIPEELEDMNESVIGCFANRTGRQGQRCIIGYNVEVGQFNLYNYPYRRSEEND